MAKTTTTGAEDTDVSFFKSLEIMAGSADLVKRHIISCIEQNEPFGIWGKAGIGKTEVVRQVAKELDMDLVIFYLQHKDKEDISGFPFPDEDPRYVTMRLMKSIPRERSKRKGTLFFWDEFNRADQAVVNACFTMMNNPRMIGDVILPDDVRIGLAANPSGLSYRVNEVEKDPAILRRATWVGMLPNHAAFVKYATSAKFHPSVINYIRRHKQWLYDNEAHNAGRVCANPASWEKVSNAVHHLEKKAPGGDLREVEVELRCNIAGLIGVSRMNDFMGELLVADGIQMPDPDEICSPTFGPGDSAYEKVQKMVAGRKSGTSGKIGDLSTSVVAHLAATQPAPATAAPSIAKFAKLLPGDTAEKFFIGMLDAIKEQDTNNQYYSAFTSVLSKQPEYLEVRKSMATKAADITRRANK